MPRLALFLLLVITVSCGRSFLWGASTAAYQVEGAWRADGKAPSNWDLWTHSTPSPVVNGDTADVADDSYHRIVSDAALLSDLHFNAYRFSLSWPRIIPSGMGPVNQEAIQHYRTALLALKAKGITPLITLFHWDLPAAMGDYRNASFPEAFANYAAVCFEAFADLADLFVTFNEPFTFILAGYTTQGGPAPPVRCNNATQCPSGGNEAREPYAVGRHVLLAHGMAVAKFRAMSLSPSHAIGMVLNAEYSLPLAAGDEAAVQRHLEFQWGWFCDPLVFAAAPYPQSMVDAAGDRLPPFSAQEAALLVGSLDFVGLNYYSTSYVSEAHQANVTFPYPGYYRDEGIYRTFSRDGVPIGVEGASSWLYSYAPGLKGLATWVFNRYALPIYVTENGFDVKGESQMSLEEALHDRARIQYFEEHIQALQESREKCDILGYFAWSLYDNMEWAEGYSKRFGITAIADRKEGNFTRIWKGSAFWWEKFNRERELGM